MSEVLLDPAAIALALGRMAAEIGAQSSAPILVGIRRGGEPLARRLAAMIERSTGQRPPMGVVDITLYRDDAATALPNLRIGPSRLPVPIDGRRVILCDDVLYTGRTIRAALDAVLDYGRPEKIELAVLVDRGGRELPIQPDYVGLRAKVAKGARVEVMHKRTGPGPDDDELWALSLERGERG